MNTTNAYIFDVDGTLVDSNDFHAHAWVKAFAEFEHEISFEQIRPLIGMGGDKLVKALIGVEKDNKMSKTLSKVASQVFKREYLSQVKTFPEAATLLRFLKGRGHTLAVASSADEEVLQHLLSRIQAKEVIDVIVSSAEVAATKPDSDLIIAALQRLNLPAAKVRMVGDTCYDIEAATKVGVATIAFLCGGSSEQSLQGAAEIYQGPAEFLKALKG